MGRFENYCERKGVRVSVKYLGVRTNEDKWKHTAWKVKLTYKRRSLTTDYKMGMGLHGEPKAYQVLESVLLDASLGGETFEEWCGNFGYDTDSRKAEASYLACKRMVGKVAQFLQGEVDDFRDASNEE